MSTARSRSRSAKRPEKAVQKKHLQFIVLDCGPGLPRPGDLLPAALEGTTLQVQSPVSKLFGEWTWDYAHVPEQEYRDNVVQLSSHSVKSVRPTCYQLPASCHPPPATRHQLPNTSYPLPATSYLPPASCYQPLVFPATP